MDIPPQLVLVAELFTVLYAQVKNVAPDGSPGAGLPEAPEGCNAAATRKEGAGCCLVEGQLKGDRTRDAHENVVFCHLGTEALPAKVEQSLYSAREIVKSTVLGSSSSGQLEME
ncbi:hypothetical protein HYQ46_001813 [Verticillium longisporum]|nr:hypothetical protein HYQ46_001813 [Verticillium longisporum]